MNYKCPACRSPEDLYAGGHSAQGQYHLVTGGHVGSAILFITLDHMSETLLQVRWYYVLCSVEQCLARQSTWPSIKIMRCVGIYIWRCYVVALMRKPWKVVGR